MKSRTRTAGEIKQFLQQHLAAQARVAKLREDWIEESDLSMTEAGLIDSLGFIELLGSAEQHFGVEVDLSLYDPSEFSTVGGFVRCLLEAPTTP